MYYDPNSPFRQPPQSSFDPGTTDAIRSSTGLPAPHTTPTGQEATAPTSPNISVSTGFMAPSNYTPAVNSPYSPRSGFSGYPPPAYGLNYGRPQYTPAAQYARPYVGAQSYGNDGIYIPPQPAGAPAPASGEGINFQSLPDNRQQAPQQRQGSYGPFGGFQPAPQPQFQPQFQPQQFQFQPQQFQQLFSILQRLFGGGGYGGGYGTGIGNAPAAAYF